MVELSGIYQGLHERPRYGYSDAWQHFIAERAQRTSASQSAHPPQSSGNLPGDSPFASLKAPHMPFATPAISTIAFGAGTSPSFATPPAFASRTGDLLFRPPAAAPFSFMQAPFTFQARPGPAPSMQLSGRAAPSAPGGSNVFTAPFVASTFASTTVSAPHSLCFVFPQPSSGLLPPLVRPMAFTAPDRTIQGSMSTGQHSDAFTSWSHPASATGQSPWTKTTEVFRDEGP